MAPIRPSPAQNNTTTMNPSRRRNSLLTLCTGSHRNAPRQSISIKHSMNVLTVLSSYHSAMLRGGSMVILNSISSSPRIFWITRSCIISPDLLPGRLSLLDICLLSFWYDYNLIVSSIQAALDAPSLVFFAPTSTCSLRPSLGATQRAAVAVQIVCPDDLSLNQRSNYAFGRMPSLAQKIRRVHCAHPWTQPNGRPLAVQIVYPDDLSSHHLARNPGWNYRNVILTWNSLSTSATRFLSPTSRMTWSSDAITVS